MLNWIMGIIGVGAIISMAATFIVNNVKDMKDVHARNLVTLGATMAEETCFLFHDKNLFTGTAVMPRIQEAAKALVDKLSAAGYTVSIEATSAMIRTAHQRLTLDKTTAYNDKAAA